MALRRGVSASCSQSGVNIHPVRKVTRPFSLIEDPSSAPFAMPILRHLSVLVICFVTVLSAFADVSAVRIVGDGAPTRITIWSDTAQNPQAYARETGGDRQIILPINGAVVPTSGEGGGGIASWALSDGELSFSLEAPLVISRVLTLPPTGSATSHRTIIDLEMVSASRFTSHARRDAKRYAKATREAATTEVAVRTPPSGRKSRASKARYVVVVDAGHGGKDPGASAVTGGVEKAIVLSAALKLKELLERDGRYEVRLTRDDDTYVEHEDRVSLARDWGADLFISLHADAAGAADVEGASIYTISANGEKRIDKEARKNNWKIPIEDGTSKQVGGILEDLVKRETRTRSEEFAELLLPELKRAGPVLRSTHRNAGFYVLLAPDVPAVLLELGFLTNAKDAKRLQSQQGQNKSMAAVKRGIDKFFDAQEVLYAGH